MVSYRSALYWYLPSSPNLLAFMIIAWTRIRLSALTLTLKKRDTRISELVVYLEHFLCAFVTSSSSRPPLLLSFGNDLLDLSHTWEAFGFVVIIADVLSADVDITAHSHLVCLLKLIVKMCDEDLIFKLNLSLKLNPKDNGIFLFLM
jgi:hypothetical protein